MIALSEIILLGPLTAAMALWQKHLIKKDRHIQHGWWAVVFCVPLAGAVVWQWHVLATPVRISAFILACLVGRLVVFNTLLNAFRGLQWDYINPKGKSVIDDLEVRLFGSRVWLLEVILAVVFIILQFFIRGRL